jgi:MoxR-like ATPase
MEEALKIGNNLQSSLAEIGHFIDEATATQLEMAWQQRLPVLVEGLPGAGKTVLVKKFAEAKKAELYRLQCYEGLDFQGVLYKWDVTLQKLFIEEARQNQVKEGLPKLTGEALRKISYSCECLIPGILMKVLATPQSILLIDELDKASKAFSNALLEFLGEFQITINEIGETVKPTTQPPFVMITSNAGAGNSECEKLEDPILRRCIYINIPLPTTAQNFQILRNAAPQLPINVTIDCTNFVKYLNMRGILEKPCSLAEARMWVILLANYQVTALTEAVIKQSVGTVAKTPDDIERLLTNVTAILNYIDRERTTLAQALLKGVKAA